MPRYSNLTEKELLEKEEEWWEWEDETNFMWLDEGVEIFQRLSRVNQNEVRYREILAYLLLKQGEDLKLRQRSYDRAIMSFRQLVRIHPENARAYYRLGFLYFYQEEWLKSIDSFQQSLSRHPRQPSNQLNKEQQIKAHYYILKATQIIMNQTLGKVEEIPSQDLELFEEIKHLMEEMKDTARGEEKPYQMIVNGKEFSEISEREYEKLTDIFENKNILILNQRSLNDTTFALNGREVTIPGTQVPLLEFLMRHPEGVKKEDIIQRMFRQSKNPDAALRRMISRLRRERLDQLSPLNDWIVTKNGTYRWVCLEEYRMFKHNRDVSTDLLLD